VEEDLDPALQPKSKKSPANLSVYGMLIELSALRSKTGLAFKVKPGFISPIAFNFGFIEYNEDAFADSSANTEGFAEHALSLNIVIFLIEPAAMGALHLRLAGEVDSFADIPVDFSGFA
tara:strand:- start:24 stop:380 length:357 start_codon:yes stop_codon:yes gene_type:complete